MGGLLKWIVVVGIGLSFLKVCGYIRTAPLLRSTMNLRYRFSHRSQSSFVLCLNRLNLY